MKIKFTLIPFIPVTIATVVIKIMSLFGLDENGMFLGLNKMGLNYAVIGLTLGLFVVCVFINLFDRKTAPVYPVKKNFAAGILAVLSGVFILVTSVLKLVNMAGDSDYYIISLVTALFSIPAAIAFLFISKVHFAGKSIISGISALFIFPTLWSCAKLVSMFLAATKVSISATDMTSLFCYIFLTLYLFSNSMIVSRIKGRNPVKSCFIFGLPAVAISLSYGIYVVLTSAVEGVVVDNILIGANFIVLALYALSFIIEMFFGIVTKDEIEIIEGLPDDEDTYEKSYVKSGAYDDLVFSDRNADDIVSENSPLFSGGDMDEFVIGFNSDNDQAEINSAKIISQDVVFGVDNVEQEEASVEENVEQEEIAVEEPTPEVIVDEVESEIVEDIPMATDITTDDDALNKRLSEIDLLLQELENKKWYWHYKFVVLLLFKRIWNCEKGHGIYKFHFQRAKTCAEIFVFEFIFYHLLSST